MSDVFTIWEMLPNVNSFEMEIMRQFAESNQFVQFKDS